MKKLKLFNYDSIKPRLYQELIASTAVKKNCLVVLPTGIGKTLISILVGMYRLEKFPNKKILITSPTRPLNAQHVKSFKKFTFVDPKKITLITGKIKAEDREILYEHARIIVATPQCIKNDVENGILSLADFSMICFDEAHRCVKDYAYTYVAKKYIEQCSNPLILGLTASPGGIKDRIERVKGNLFIEAVEIRTEKDVDVKPYIQEMKIERIYVELPEELKRIRRFLEEAYRKRLNWLITSRLITSMKVTKKQLLDLQKEIGKMYEQTRDFMVAKALTTCAQAIKIEHAIGLLETQGITPLYKYFLDLQKNQKSMATKRVLNDQKIVKAMRETKELFVKGIEHPKLDKLLEIVKKEVKKNPYIKIIVFANFRYTVEKIVKLLELNGIEAKEFIGQAKKGGKGLKQKEQIEILNEFKYELFNVLTSTSIGEEGLDLFELNLVIFYDSVPSAIRLIQRRGRTGRTRPGKVIFLITKNTRDEGYYWSAIHKERRMKKILYDMKEGRSKKEDISLRRWVK